MANRMDWFEEYTGVSRRPRDLPPSYKTAQMCLNGHVIADDLEISPARSSKFCPTCGVETISACPNCQVSIRGHFHVPGVFAVSKYVPPAYCYNCGKSFPWTEKAMSAARELADESDELSSEEKTQLKSAIQNLSIDSPRTQIASVRYKKLIAKVAPAVAKGMNELLVTLATEAAKKALGF